MKLKIDIFLYTTLQSNIMNHVRHSKIGGSNMVNIQNNKADPNIQFLLYNFCV